MAESYRRRLITGCVVSSVISFLERAPIICAIGGRSLIKSVFHPLFSQCDALVRGSALSSAVMRLEALLRLYGEPRLFSMLYYMSFNATVKLFCEVLSC